MCIHDNSNKGILIGRALLSMALLCLVLLLTQGGVQARQPDGGSETAGGAPRGRPLATLLNSDGTLNLRSNYQGSIDPSGWRLVSGPDEAPRFVPTSTEDDGWSDLFAANGLNGGARALALYQDALYVAGGFNLAGDVEANNIARWDGSAWASLGSGTANGVNNLVFALAVYSDSLYVGGQFTQAGGQVTSQIARWDGVGWSPVVSGTANGTNLSVNALAVYSDSLYVGGQFTQAGGVVANRIARWDGVRWSPVVSGTANGFSGTVYALTVYSDSLYIGGGFGTAGGESINSIARWDGTRFFPLATGNVNGVTGIVYALAVYSDSLYVGGQFTQVGGTSAANIARWDGVTWSLLGSGVLNTVHTLTIYDDGLIAGGRFTIAGGQPAQYIARWDGTSWSPLAGGLFLNTGGATVQALAPYQGTLFVAGFFHEADGMVSNYIAQWNGSSWASVESAPRHGLNNDVFALAVYSDALYAGGQFRNAGTVKVNRVARWDGASWSPLGDGAANGTNREIFGMAVYSGTLIVGGDFSTAGGVTHAYIAQWDGANWSAVGNGGFNGIVRAFAVYQGDLIVGGNFTLAGNMTANRIARWDGVTWSPLISGTANGVSGAVLALAVYNDELYVGGNMTTAGGQTASRIARWDGVAWSPVLSGTNNGVNLTVRDLTVHDGALYAGGDFTIAGGQSANRIGRWDGTRWSALGSGASNGVNAQVHDLTVYSDTLVVAGQFSQAGGADARAIVRWDGAQWLPVGQGLQGNTGVGTVVWSLAVDSAGRLYAAGNFALAGGKASWNIARWSAADLSLSKTAVPASGYVGQPITYTLVVSNAGPSSAEHIWLTDTLPAGLLVAPLPPGCGGSNVISCTLGTLAHGEAVTITLVATPTLNDLFTNMASVTSVVADLNPENNHASVTVPVEPAADLRLTKWTSLGPRYAEDPFTYTLVVTNDGPSAAPGVVVTDILPPGLFVSSSNPSCAGISTLACPLGTISAGAMATLTLVVTSTTGGTYTNTATVASAATDLVPSNNNASAVAAVNARMAELALTKHAITGTIYAGTALTYTLVVSNSGPQEARDVVLTDTLPNGLLLASAPPTCVGSTTITCEAGSIAHGSAVSITLVVTPTAGGLVFNTATVSARELDPIPSNNEATAMTEVSAQSDLMLTKVASTASIIIGQPLTYTLVVTNRGPSGAHSVRITDSLPVSMALASASPGCSGTGTVICLLGSLASGQTTTTTLVVTPTAGGTFTNTALVRSAITDITLDNNSASATTMVRADSDLAVSKGAQGPFLVGLPFTYTITVTNSGPAPAHGVLLADMLPVSMILAHASPGCAGTPLVTCDLGTLVSGQSLLVGLVVTPTRSGVLTNTATVESITLDPTLTNNSATTSVVVGVCADVAADQGVTIADIQTVASHWGLTTQDQAWDWRFDFVPDNTIDTLDVVFAADLWQTFCP